MPFPKKTRTGRKIIKKRGKGDRDREEEKERGSKEEHIQAAVPMEEEMEEEEVSAGTQEEKVSTAGMTGMTGQDGEGQD